MGVQSDLVIADLADAQDVAESEGPASQWEGFTFNGLDNVKLCTLLSLLAADDPMSDFDRFHDRIQVVSPPTDDGPIVHAIHRAEVAELAKVAAMESEEFDQVVNSWGGTEEFEGWSSSEVRDLLQSVGNLAETASLEGKCLLLWCSL